MTRPGRRLPQLLLSLAVTLVMLAIGEVAMRRLLCAEAGVETFELVRERYLGKRLAIFSENERKDPCTALVPGTKVDKSISINSFGLRGREVARDKAPGTLRIICLGGSSVFGTGSSGDATTWPALLEAECNHDSPRTVEVLNAGVPGFTSAQSVERFLVCCRRFRADVAILCNEFNDIISRRISRLAYDPREDAPVATDTAFQRALSHSAIYLRIRAGANFVRKQSRVAAEVAKADEAAAKKSAIDAGLERERTAGQGAYYEPSDLEEFRTNLRRFVAGARETQCVPVIATEPLAFAIASDEATYRRDGEVLAFYFPDHARFVELARAFHTVVREVAAETGALLFDGDAAMSHDPSEWDDFIHTNDKGAAAMSKAVLRTLRDAKLVHTR